MEEDPSDKNSIKRWLRCEFTTVLRGSNLALGGITGSTGSRPQYRMTIDAITHNGHN